MPPKNKLPDLAQARDQMSVLIAALKPSRSIKRIEIRVQPVDMLSWLAMQSDDVKIYGANQSDAVSIAGIGQAVCVKAKGVDSFKTVFPKLRRRLSPQYPYLQWYGGFCFDKSQLGRDWKEFGACRFVLPRFELASQGGKMIFCCNLAGRENTAEVLKQLAAIKVKSHSFPRRGYTHTIIRRVDKPNKKLWQKEVLQILQDSSVEKVVLARKTSLYFKKALDPWGMLWRLKKVTPHSYHFAFQFKNSVFLGASPERLYRRCGRSIESEALAGTMPLSTGPRRLQKSHKNRHEHAFVVDAIHASFKKLCSRFRQDKSPRVMTLSSGHHLITKFQGQLKDGVSDEDILKSLHPTPALGGTPKAQAMATIRRLEGFSRGWYGAPIGHVGIKGAEFVVAIRSGLVSAKRLSIFAGAGIVEGSQASAEWAEVENKIGNFIKIIR